MVRFNVSHRSSLLAALSCAGLFLLSSCADESTPDPADSSAAQDAAQEDAVGSDAVESDAAQSDIELADGIDDGGDTDGASGDAMSGDVEADAEVEQPPEFPLETRQGITVADDPLPETMTSCAVYQEEVCDGGTLRRCDTWSTSGGDWGEPDDLLRRVLLYDRWYDLYHQPDGQTADRGFNGPIPAGTPEATWGDPENFGSWHGAGDSAIWTGTALNAYLFRYAELGTAADRERVRHKVDRHLKQFEVTGIPGYLARYHYLEVPSGAPLSADHIYKTKPSKADPRDHTFDPAAVGLEDVYGGATGTPMWHGNPSIDQYSGPLTALPIAYDLLDDEDLRERITTQLTCYLKRLEKLEIINVDQNPDALLAIQGLLGGGALTLDPGDIDLTELDAIYAYYLPQPNHLNEDTFDTGCPETLSTTPTRSVDATSDTFLFDLLGLGNDLASKDNPSPTAIDHIYISVRGGDAMHLIHMAAIAWHLTGDEMYRTWLQEEVLGTFRALEIVDTAGAFQLPPWCTSYYGHHITFMPWWGLIEMLEPGALRQRLEAAFHHELWELTMADLRNAKFNIMYGGALEASVATDRDAAVADALAQLELLGGNGGVMDDPRRTYALEPQDVLDGLPVGAQTRCPTEAERSACEDGFEILGIPIPGESITHACTGGPLDCPMEGDTCATRIASPGLPANLRKWEDFIWQRNPFAIGSGGNGGYTQSPGLDLTESYWLARYYGLIEDPAAMVLAWREMGSCAAPEATP